MIYLLHVSLMLLSMTILTAFLWVTRRYDDILWWTLRCLLLHSLIAVVYMAYDAVDAGFTMSLSLILIRSGFATLTMALALLWFLLHCERKNHRRQRFNDRINHIFKDSQ